MRHLQRLDQQNDRDLSPATGRLRQRFHRRWGTHALSACSWQAWEYAAKAVFLTILRPAFGLSHRLVASSRTMLLIRLRTYSTEKMNVITFPRNSREGEVRRPQRPQGGIFLVVRHDSAA